MQKLARTTGKTVVLTRPQTTLEGAAELLLKHKIGGLPVVEDGQLVGIITTSDILQAFLDVMGHSARLPTTVTSESIPKGIGKRN